MKVYLTNAFSLSMLTGDYAKLTVREMTLQEAKSFLKTYGFISAIGHSSTAELLTSLLEMKVEMNRIQVKLEPSDVVVVFQLQTRLAENQVLTKEELEKLQYKFYKVEMNNT
ncbi:MAG: DUF1874 domain-containing protein [Sulfurihydrogenibium sp.]|nr:DUF1874 domain-containing protein [Sulfurihydrogenibium sp.]